MVNGEQGHIVGIDLGTTMSVIAHLDANGGASAIPNSEGEPLTPSAVYLDGVHAVVGKAAKAAAALHPDKVAMYIKRYMGKAQYDRPVDGRMFCPETLSAIILRKLKQDAERRIGPISRAVITVPAFFDDTRRKATEDAGRIAGLDVMEIINEPTAAALAFSLEGRLNRAAGAAFGIPEGEMTVVVYDLGGGTFDVTVVHLADKDFATIATDGAVQLGGKDWDEKIVQHVCEQFTQRFGVNPAEEPKPLASIVNAAETTKKLLSQLPTAPLDVSCRDHNLDITFTREQFEQLSRDLLLATSTVTDLVVNEQAKLTWEQVDRVLLVGGSTRMPMVKKMLRGLTGKEPDDRLDPDQVVARGAAIFAAILGSRNNDSNLEIDEEMREELRPVRIEDVNSHSLGVAAWSQNRSKFVNAVLIEKNTRLPFAASKVFKLRKAGATSVTVRVLEGEARDDADANIQLGECEVTNLPAGLPAKAPVQVRLSYETNGRVRVMALDMTGGNLAHAEIQRQSGLTEEDIRREAEFVNSLNIQ